MNKYIELGKKLNELVKRGVGGEKINAEKMLSDLLKKHNLSIEDIEGKEVDNFFFKIKSEDANLLQQIVKRVNYELDLYGEFPAKDVKRLQMEGNFCTKCTASQFVEIKSMFDFYNDLYKQELKIFYSAFLTANDLLARPSKEDSISINDLNKEELEKWARTQMMARGIKKKSFQKRIQG